MAVEIEWIDSESPAATGTKIYRDDVEIADIANGVQFYSDDTVDPETEYKYEVQAHDGAGDETTQEVEGENMDYITTEASGPVEPENEHYPNGNAASRFDELDNVGPWTNGSGGAVSTVSDDMTNGAFAVKHNINGAGSLSRMLWNMPVTNGHTYDVTMDYKNPQGNGRIWVVSNVIAYDSLKITDTGWNTYKFQVTATADGTTLFRVYSGYDAAVDGDYCLTDNMSVLDLGVI